MADRTLEFSCMYCVLSAVDVPSADRESRTTELKGSGLCESVALLYQTPSNQLVQTTTGCGTRSAPVWVHTNLFRQLSRDGNLHGSGMSHAPTASPKPSVRAPWSVVGRRRGRRGKCWMDNIKRLDIPYRAGTGHNCLLQKRLDGDLC